MKINTKRVVSVIITAVMMVVMLPSFAMGESGKKYTETLQPEGWTLVENEGGATLSYTKGGGVDLRIPLIIAPKPSTSSPPTQISRKSAIQAHCLHAK